jgi:RNA ligase
MLETLNKYYEEGLVTKQVHPVLPLTIWNYTDKVQYENLWDDVTIMTRGLVTNNEGDIIARPFKKFFNLNEGKHTPTEEFEVFEKMDGSLGILFNYNGEWILATRGSFTSDQAVRGMEILKKYKYERLIPGFTYLFEIIYPENRIVVDYDGMEDLVLLAVIDNTDGYELKIHDDKVHLGGIRLINLYNNLGFKVVKKYNGITDYSILAGMISNDREGYVVKFSNGNRVKIKGDEYLRLHKIMTNMSTTAIWESLKNGDEIENFLKDVPDEFYEKIKNEREKLIDKYKNIELEYRLTHELISRYPDSVTRKGYAEKAIKFNYPKLLFLMLDEKDYSSCLWDLIKPEFKKL